MTSSPHQLWVDTHATGFADVYFMMTGDAQWSAKGRIVEQEIPGGNVTLMQFMGMGPQQCTYKIYLATVDDLERLIALIGTFGVLTVFPGTAAVPKQRVVIAGDEYDRIGPVILADVSGTSFKRDRVECNATFKMSTG